MILKDFLITIDSWAPKAQPVRMCGTCGCERRQMFVCDAGIHVSRNFSSRVSREPKGNRRARSVECPPPHFLERSVECPPPPPPPHFFGKVHLISLWTVEPPNTSIYRPLCFKMARGKQETVVRHLSSAYCALNFDFQRSPSNLYSLKKNSYF